MKINATDLQQEWVHSSEEDSSDATVFRPATFAFPLTRRPRNYFQLHTDGTLTQGQGTPADSLQEVQGHWTLKNNELILHPVSMSPCTYQIRSVASDKLVLKK